MLKTYYLAGVGAHFIVALLVLAASHILPDQLTSEPAFRMVAGVVRQPFIGPDRLVTLPASLRTWGDGVPLLFANSLAWGALLMLPMWAWNRRLWRWRPAWPLIGARARD